jgi:hypothetical protein
MRIQRWNPSTWMLVSLGLIIVLVGADQVRRSVVGAGPERSPAAARPPGKRNWMPVVGGQALDFGLPDIKGKVHRLSEFKGRPVILTFFCGCPTCKDMATQLARARRETPHPPPVLSVFTSHWSPGGTPAFANQSGGTDFTYVHSGPDSTVVDSYQGTPCPKVYVLDKVLKIRYISPADVVGTNNETMLDVSHMLGLRYRPGAPPRPGPPPRPGAAASAASKQGG